MKKILLSIFTGLFIYSASFAQNTAYEIHLEKAKQYEAQKEYVYALGEYYEAMSEEKSLSAKDAYEGWLKLSEIIQSGKPGYGNFDDFTLVDEWISQLQNFEKYWTEFCPILIICEPKRTQLNRTDKTATYEMQITWESSPKYEEIKNIFQAGLKNAYSSDWQMPFLEEWPLVSIYNTKEYKNIFLQNGTALAQNLSKYNNSGRYIYSEYKLVASLAEFGCIKKNLADYYDAYNPTTLYDIKLKLIDDSNKEIFSGQRLLLGPISKYTFNVTQEQMQKIESGKISIVPDAIFLQYGNIPTEPWITEDSRDWIKTLSEIKFDNKKVTVILKNDLNEYEISSVEVLKDIMDQYKKQEETRIRAEERNKEIEEEERISREYYLRELETTWNSLVYTTSASYQYSYGKYFVKIPDGITDAIIFFENLFPDYQEKYSFEQILYASRLVLCNEISKYEELEQAYILSEKNGKETFTDRVLFCLDNLNNISANIKTKGYRVPEKSEIDYLRKKGNSQLLDYIIIRNSK